MRSRRIFALVLSALVTLATTSLAGCCGCDERAELGPRGPGDVVRALRDAIGDRRFARAQSLFSDDLHARYGDQLADAAFYEKGPAPDGGPAGPAVEWPLGPRDSLVEVRVEGDSAEATIDHLNRTPGDPRPRSLLLRRSNGLWRITGWKA